MRAGSVLRGNPAFRALWSARVVSYAGDSLSLVALMLFVADRTGQGFAVALLLLAGDFAPSLLSPLTAALGDRFDRRRLMIGCELVQCGLLVAIAVSLPALPLLLALVAVRALAGQAFGAASRAAVPALVDGAQLAPANAALGFGTNAGEVAGPLAAALLLPAIGVRGVLLVDAATFAVSALLLVRLPALRHAATERTTLLGDARLGLRYIRTTPLVRVVALGFFAVVLCNGVDDVALVILATQTFEAGPAAVGLLLAAVGIGLITGYAVLSRLGSGVAMPVLLVVGFAVSSAGNLLTGLAWAVAAAFAMQAVRGIGIAAIDVAVNTMLQRAVPDAMQARVFGNLYGAIGVAAAVSYVGGGLLLDATSAPTTLVLAGAGGLLATVATAFALRRVDTGG